MRISLIAGVAGLALVVASGAIAQSPDAAAPRVIILDVTWKLAVRGYESQAQIELQASYEVRPWSEFGGGGEWGETTPAAVCGGAAASSCFVLKYRAGRLASASGRNSAGDPAVFSAEPEKPEAGAQPDGLIRPAPNGSIQIVLYRQPGFRGANGAAEEALGCLFKSWMSPTISSSDLRTLHTLRRQWDGPAAGADDLATAPGCEPGSLSIEITGWRSCESLRTVCEQTRTWLGCAGRDLADIVSSVPQARLEAGAERAAQQRPGVPELPGYPQLLLAFDRLIKTIPDLEARVAAIEGAIAPDCASLPGPTEEAACQKATRRVEDELEKIRTSVKHGLDAETAIFEDSTVPAAGFVARGELLTRLRAARAQLDVCR